MTSKKFYPIETSLEKIFSIFEALNYVNVFAFPSDSNTSTSTSVVR